VSDPLHWIKILISGSYSELDYPEGIEVDFSGNIYTALKEGDYLSYVAKFNTLGECQWVITRISPKHSNVNILLNDVATSLFVINDLMTVLKVNTASGAIDDTFNVPGPVYGLVSSPDSSLIGATGIRNNPKPTRPYTTLL
jgi:hypothetical protein